MNSFSYRNPVCSDCIISKIKSSICESCRHKSFLDDPNFPSKHMTSHDLAKAREKQKQVEAEKYRKRVEAHCDTTDARMKKIQQREMRGYQCGNYSSEFEQKIADLKRRVHEETYRTNKVLINTTLVDLLMPIIHYIGGDLFVNPKQSPTIGTLIKECPVLGT